MASKDRSQEEKTSGEPMKGNAMLVLSRKVGEEIVIDGNIRIVINRVAGDRVTLAFKAPDDVKILRAELTPHDPDAPPKPKESTKKTPRPTNRRTPRLRKSA